MPKTISVKGQYIDGRTNAVLAEKVQIAIPLLTLSEHEAAKALYSAEAMWIGDAATSESWFQFKNTVLNLERSARYPFAARPAPIIDWWDAFDRSQWDKLLCWATTPSGDMFSTYPFYDAFDAGELIFKPDGPDGHVLAMGRNSNGTALITVRTAGGNQGTIRCGHITGHSSAGANGGFIFYIVTDDNYEQPREIPGSTAGGGVNLGYNVNGTTKDVFFGTVNVSTSTATCLWFWDVTHTILDVLPVDDPYAPKPEDPTSPPGSFEIPDVVQDFPDMPPSFADLGFMTLYRMTGDQARTLAHTLWSGDILDRLKVKIANPMDVITSLHHLPFEVPAGSAPVPIRVGAIDTQCPALEVTQQIVDIDFGPVTVKPFWGSYLDYSPHTRYQLYLPYIGSVDINADDITGKEILIKYRVDVASGDAVVFVKAGNFIAYQHTCNLATAIPVTSGDGRTMTQKIIGAVAPMALAAAGAAVGGAAGAAIGSRIGQTSTEFLGNSTNEYGLTDANYRVTKTGNPTAGRYAGAGVGGAIGKTAGDIMASKISFTKFGPLSGATGYLGYMSPFLYAVRPNIVNPARYAETKGYPCHETRALGDVSGFSIFEHPHLENTGLTDGENEELARLLESGVIL